MVRFKRFSNITIIGTILGIAFTCFLSSRYENLLFLGVMANSLIIYMLFMYLCEKKIKKMYLYIYYSAFMILLIGAYLLLLTKDLNVILFASSFPLIAVMINSITLIEDPYYVVKGIIRPDLKERGFSKYVINKVIWIIMLLSVYVIIYFVYYH